MLRMRPSSLALAAPARDTGDTGAGDTGAARDDTADSIETTGSSR